MNVPLLPELADKDELGRLIVFFVYKPNDLLTK